MDEIASQPIEGLVLMALRIRDEDRRKQAIHRLLDISADRLTSTIFEFSIADWDEGLWEEEIEWFTELLDGSRDSIIVWCFRHKSYSRFSIGTGG
jgi:hypothetical protein